MEKVQLFLAEWLLGYFLQCGGYILGICAVAKKRLGLAPFLAASVVFSIATYLVRTLGNFNFGIHTMLILLIVNAICVIFLKIDVRPSVLGSLLVTILVLAGELINYSLLMAFFDQAQITANMTQPLFKAWAGVPGNVILGAVVVLAYVMRSVKGKKTDGKAG